MPKVKKKAKSNKDPPTCFACNCSICGGTGFDPDEHYFTGAHIDCECAYYAHEYNDSCVFKNENDKIVVKQKREMKDKWVSTWKNWMFLHGGRPLERLADE